MGDRHHEDKYMRDSKHTLSPETVLDVRPRYVVFRIPSGTTPNLTDVSDDSGQDIYYIGPYPRPLANYIRIRMLHNRDKLYDCEREWAPGYSWVVSTKKVKGKHRRYHSPYPMEGIQSQLRDVMAYWERVCCLLGVVDIPSGVPEGLEDEEDWRYLRYSKGGLPHHLGPYPVPVLKAIRKYLEVLDLQPLDIPLGRRAMASPCIYRNPQLGSTLDASVTYEMVQEFCRERLSMYYTLYSYTIPFASLEEVAV